MISFFFWFQLEYGGWWQSGSALTNGEEAEQVNSYLSRISNTTKYMLSESQLILCLEDLIPNCITEANTLNVI